MTAKKQRIVAEPPPTARSVGGRSPTGTVFTDKRTGKLRCQWQDETGKRGSKTLGHCRTMREAWAELHAILAEIEPRRVPKGTEVPTFEAVALRMIEEGRKSGMRAIEDRRRDLRNHVFPVIGQTLVIKVEPAEVFRIFRAMRDEGAAQSTMNHVRTAVYATMRQAANEGLPVRIRRGDLNLPPVLASVREAGKRQRAVLTDAELRTYLKWQHPVEEYREGVRERQLLVLVARCFGGARTGDLHAMTWQSLGAPDFGVGVVPREKGEAPQRMEIPDVLRPYLVERWEASGKDPAGYVFPVMRDRTGGRRAGERRGKHSHALEIRRDLRRAFGIDALVRSDVKRRNGRPLHQPRWELVRPMTAREKLLFSSTDLGLQLDFHSTRRAFVQATADAGLNLQQSMKLSGHLTTEAHMVYNERAERPMAIPKAVLPKLGRQAKRQTCRNSQERAPAAGAIARETHEPEQPEGEKRREKRSGWTDSNRQQPAPKGDETPVFPVQTPAGTCSGTPIFAGCRIAIARAIARDRLAESDRTSLRNPGGWVRLAALADRLIAAGVVR